MSAQRTAAEAMDYAVELVKHRSVVVDRVPDPWDLPPMESVELELHSVLLHIETGRNVQGAPGLYLVAALLEAELLGADALGIHHVTALGIEFLTDRRKPGEFDIVRTEDLGEPDNALEPGTPVETLSNRRFRAGHLAAQRMTPAKLDELNVDAYLCRTTSARELAGGDVLMSHPAYGRMVKGIEISGDTVTVEYFSGGFSILPADDRVTIQPAEAVRWARETENKPVDSAPGLEQLGASALRLAVCLCEQRSEDMAVSDIIAACRSTLIVARDNQGTIPIGGPWDQMKGSDVVMRALLEVGLLCRDDSSNVWRLLPEGWAIAHNRPLPETGPKGERVTPKPHPQAGGWPDAAEDAGLPGPPHKQDPFDRAMDVLWRCTAAVHFPDRAATRAVLLSGLELAHHSPVHDGHLSGEIAKTTMAALLEAGLVMFNGKDDTWNTTELGRSYLPEAVTRKRAVPTPVFETPPVPAPDGPHFVVHSVRELAAEETAEFRNAVREPRTLIVPRLAMIDGHKKLLRELDDLGLSGWIVPKVLDPQGPYVAVYVTGPNGGHDAELQLKLHTVEELYEAIGYPS